MYSIPGIDRLISHVRRRTFVVDSDSLNYCVAVVVLITGALALAGNNYTMKTLDCYPSSSIVAQSITFVESRCFVEGTYVKLNGTSERKTIDYYSWLSCALSLQAVCFYLPAAIWDFLIGLNTVTPLRNMMNKASDPDCLAMSSKVAELARMLTASIRASGRYQRYWTRHLSASYLLSKWLYLVNSLGQLWFLQWLLSEKSLFWGASLLMDIFRKEDWRTSMRFPRQTLCDAKVIDGNAWHTSTINCVLNGMVLAEKVFTGVWFLVLVIAVINAASLAFWMIVTLVPCCNRRKIWGYVKRSEKCETAREDRKRLLRDMSYFVSNILCPDGVLTLRLMEGQGYSEVVEAIIENLWLDFQGPA